MAIHLGRPLPDASRDLPGRRRGNTPVGQVQRVAPIWSCSRWGLPCRPRYRGRGALLPHPFTLTLGAGARQAVCFLWHFPWGCPRRPLTGTVFPWSPDFPPLAGFPSQEAAIRPSGKPKLVLRTAASSVEGFRDKLQHSLHQRRRLAVNSPINGFGPEVALKGGDSGGNI